MMIKCEPREICLTWRQVSVLESLLGQAMDEYFQDVAECGVEDDIYIRDLTDMLVKVEDAQEIPF